MRQLSGSKSKFEPLTSPRFRISDIVFFILFLHVISDHISSSILLCVVRFSANEDENDQYFYYQ